MGAQFTTNFDFSENTESVVITRVALGGVDGNDKTVTQIYEGPGDLQYNAGGLVVNPGGTNDTSEAVLVIDALANGTFPAIKIDDVVAIDGVNFLVVLVETWRFPPAHLELRLNRGTVKYSGSPG